MLKTFSMRLYFSPFLGSILSEGAAEARVIYTRKQSNINRIWTLWCGLPLLLTFQGVTLEICWQLSGGVRTPRTFYKRLFKAGVVPGVWVWGPYRLVTLLKALKETFVKSIMASASISLTSRECSRLLDHDFTILAVKDRKRIGNPSLFSSRYTSSSHVSTGNYNLYLWAIILKGETQRLISCCHAKFSGVRSCMHRSIRETPYSLDGGHGVVSSQIKYLHRMKESISALR